MNTLWIKFKNSQTLKNVLINDFNYFLNKFFISDYGFQINNSPNREIFFDDRSLWITSKSINNSIDYVSFLAKKFNTPILSFFGGNFYFFNIMGNKVDINSIKEFQNLFCIIFDYLNKDEKNEVVLQQNLSLKYENIFSNFKNQLLTYISTLNRFFDGENSTGNNIELLSKDLFNLSNGLFLKKSYSTPANNSLAPKQDSINFKINDLEIQKRENIEKAQLLDSKIIDDIFFTKENITLNNDNKDKPCFLDKNLNSCKDQFNSNHDIEKKQNDNQLDLLKLISDDKDSNYNSNINNLNSWNEKKIFLFNKYKKNNSVDIASIIAQNISIESYKIYESLMKPLWSDSYKYNFYFLSKNQFSNLNIDSSFKKEDNWVNNVNNLIANIKSDQYSTSKNGIEGKINSDNNFSEEIIDKYKFDEILCPCSDDNIINNELNSHEKNMFLNSTDPILPLDIDQLSKENLEKNTNDFHSINLLDNANNKEMFDKFNESENGKDFFIKENSNNIIEIDNSFLKDPINYKNDHIDKLINKKWIDENPDELILEYEKGESDLLNWNKEGNNMNANNKQESLNFTFDEINNDKNNNFGELNSNDNLHAKDDYLKNNKYVSFNFTNENEHEKNSSLFNTNLKSKIYSNVFNNDSNFNAKKTNASIKPVHFNFDNAPEVYDEKININVNFKNLANNFIKKENQNFIDFMELNKKDEEERLNLSLEIEKFLNELKEEKRKIQLKKQELQNKLHR